MSGAVGSSVLLAAALLPFVAGGVLALGGRRVARAAAPVALAVSAAVLLLAVAAAVLRPRVGWPFVAGGSFALRVDGLSAVLLPMVAAVAFLVLIFAAAEGTAAPGRFFGLMLLFVAAVVITVTATTLPALLAAWELMGATSYALIGFAWRRPAAVSGGLTAFLVTRSADLGLYLAAGAAIAAGSGFGLTALGTASGPWLHVAAAGVLVAGLGKAAQLPFSFWLSRAMEGPSPVSALLHSAAMVAMGGYLLVRLAPLLAASGWAAPTAAWIGVGTALLLGLVALGQRDLKQVLAASTAAQLGFVVLAAGVGSVAGGTAQLVAHAAAKALLFLVAGAWLSALGTKQLDALRGAARRWRVVGVTFTIGAASLAGLPPLSLWLAKDQILAAALAASPALYVAGLVAAALSAAYSARILALLWRRPAASDVVGSAEREWDTEEKGTRRVPGAAAVPLTLLASAVVLLGLAALPPIAEAFRGLLGDRSSPQPGLLELVASAALAVIVAVLVFRRPFLLPRMTGWLGMEAAAHSLLVRPVLRAADALARVDDRLAAGVAGVGPATVAAASALQAVEERGPVRAMDGVGRLTAAAGSAARRLQSGRLHRYYEAAVVAVAALAILLIVVR